MSLDLDGADVSVTDLQGGRAVCVRSLTPALDGGGAELPPTTGIDYHLPVPGTGGYLVLSFSTALPEPLAGAMIELFDAVAGSVRWIGG